MAIPTSRYLLSSTDESTFEPNSRGRVLRNRLAIRSKREIDKLEYQALLRIQEQAINDLTEDQTLTVEMIRGWHRAMFESIYSWAGEYRSVEVSKGGFTWPPAKQIPSNMESLNKLLKRHTPCRGTKRQVARKLAEVHAEFLFIHPFRDGNGRIARLLAMVMALQAGFAPPDYRFTGRGSTRTRVRYINALQQGYVENYEPLEDFFFEALIGEEEILDEDTGS